MSDCYVSDQIAQEAALREDFTANEYLVDLIEYEQTHISGKEVFLHLITDSLDVELMREAIQDKLVDEDSTLIKDLYIEAIKGLM
jgi:hypothetical protein